MLIVHYGFKCPNCHSSYTVKIGGNTKCPLCGTDIKPNKKSAPIIAKAQCEKCGFFTNMMIGSDKCPLCKYQL